MGYYSNKQQFEDTNFLKTLEYLSSKGVKVDPAISRIYDINVNVASGNYSNLHQLERELDSSDTNIRNYSERIEDSEHRVKESKKEVQESRTQAGKTIYFSKERKEANKRIKRAEDNLTNAKRNLRNSREAYEKYLVQLKDTEGKVKDAKEVIESCKAQNKALVNDVNKQVNLVLNFQARLQALKKCADLNKQISVGSRTVNLGTLISHLEKQLESPGLHVSLTEPLSMDSDEFIALQTIEQTLTQDEHDKISQAIPSEQRNLTAEQKEYIEKAKKYLNKSSIGDYDGR